MPTPYVRIMWTYEDARENCRDLMEHLQLRYEVVSSFVGFIVNDTVNSAFVDYKTLWRLILQDRHFARV